MKTVLFRHAERQSNGLTNPPLSPRGEEQASKLAAMVGAHLLPQPTKLLSSPRIRARQTLLPLSLALNCEIQVASELDERQNYESAQQFSTRIEKFLQQLPNQQGIIFFCTHLDWIEEAMTLIPSSSDLTKNDYATWSPGQYMEFEVSDGLWDLQTFGRITL